MAFTFDETASGTNTYHGIKGDKWGLRGLKPPQIFDKTNKIM